jgi:hypothetical protein
MWAVCAVAVSVVPAIPAASVTAVADGRVITTSIDADMTTLEERVRSRIGRHESFDTTFVVQVRTVAPLWIDHPVATTIVRNRATWDATVNVYRLQRSVDRAVIDTRSSPDVRAAALFMTVFRADLFADRALGLKPNARYRVRVRGYVGQKPDGRENDQFAAADEFVFRKNS